MDSKARDRLQPQRCKKIVMRLKERAVWAAKGVLVWLLQRPYLHWLPLRYPATASLEKWMSQATTQVQSKALPERHLKWAQKKKLFTMANLGECVCTFAIALDFNAKILSWMACWKELRWRAWQKVWEGSASRSFGSCQTGRKQGEARGRGPDADWAERRSSNKPLEKHSASRLSYLFAHLDLLSSETFSFLIFFLLLFSSLTLPISALHLSILSEVWLLNFLQSSSLHRSTTAFGSRVDDHGSWDGRWPMPSRSEWLLHERLGIQWPKGQTELGDHETLCSASCMQGILLEVYGWCSQESLSWRCNGSLADLAGQQCSGNPQPGGVWEDSHQTGARQREPQASRASLCLHRQERAPAHEEPSSSPIEPELAL